MANSEMSRERQSSCGLPSVKRQAPEYTPEKYDKFLLNPKQVPSTKISGQKGQIFQDNSLPTLRTNNKLNIILETNQASGEVNNREQHDGDNQELKMP